MFELLPQGFGINVDLIWTVKTFMCYAKRGIRSQTTLHKNHEDQVCLFHVKKKVDSAATKEFTQRLICNWLYKRRRNRKVRREHHFWQAEILRHCQIPEMINTFKSIQWSVLNQLSTYSIFCLSWSPHEWNAATCSLFKNVCDKLQEGHIIVGDQSARRSKITWERIVLHLWRRRQHNEELKLKPRRLLSALNKDGQGQTSTVLGRGGWHGTFPQAEGCSTHIQKLSIFFATPLMFICASLQ